MCVSRCTVRQFVKHSSKFCLMLFLMPPFIELTTVHSSLAITTKLSATISCFQHVFNCQMFYVYIISVSVTMWTINCDLYFTKLNSVQLSTVKAVTYFNSNPVLTRDDLTCHQFTQKLMFNVNLLLQYVLLAFENTFKLFVWHILKTEKNNTAVF